MRVSNNWNDYELIDATKGERLERWGNIILIRPDPQIIWSMPPKSPLWEKAYARYLRSNTGGGRWETYKKIPDSWSIRYRDLTFNLKPMGFKHTGLFPEQAVNWDLAAELIKTANQPLKVLNLFAYTGGATLACLGAGAHVTHVDASKGMVAWAKENAVASELSGAPVRWLVDDCVKFAQREIRRGNRYDAIIMDPPSYGRGPDGEVWKLEQQLYPLLRLCLKLLSDKPAFLMLNSYTTGLSCSVMEYLLSVTLTPELGGNVSVSEIGLPVTATGMPLACGSTAVWVG